MQYKQERTYQQQLNPFEEMQRTLDQHRFHNPLQPKTCYICKVETFRGQNTPTVRWSRAIQTALRPPLPVVVLLATLLLQTVIIAALLAS